MRLKEFLIQNDHKQAKIAELLGIDASQLSRHAQGKLMPSPDDCEKYREFSGGQVTANDFHEHFMEQRGERTNDDNRGST